MILTHPRKAEAQYKRYVKRYVRSGGRINKKILQDIAASVVIRVDKQSKILGTDLDDKTIQAAQQWAKEQGEYLKALRKEYLQSKKIRTPNELRMRLENKAKFASRNQIGNLQSEVVSTRVESQGGAKFQWITKRDERVRPEHRRKHRKVYSIRQGAPSGDAFPGQGWACRCKSRPVRSRKFRKAQADAKKVVNKFASYAKLFGKRISNSVKQTAQSV